MLKIYLFTFILFLNPAREVMFSVHSVLGSFLLWNYLSHTFTYLFNPSRCLLLIIFQRREVIRHLILRNLAKTSCQYVESETESTDSYEEQNSETCSFTGKQCWQMSNKSTWNHEIIELYNYDTKSLSNGNTKTLITLIVKQMSFSTNDYQKQSFPACFNHVWGLESKGVVYSDSWEKWKFEQTVYKWRFLNQ